MLLIQITTPIPFHQQYGLILNSMTITLLLSVMPEFTHTLQLRKYGQKLPTHKPLIQIKKYTVLLENSLCYPGKMEHQRQTKIIKYTFTPTPEGFSLWCIALREPLLVLYHHWLLVQRTTHLYYITSPQLLEIL